MSKRQNARAEMTTAGIRIPHRAFSRASSKSSLYKSPRQFCQTFIAMFQRRNPPYLNTKWCKMYRMIIDPAIAGIQEMHSSIEIDESCAANHHTIIGRQATTSAATHSQKANVDRLRRWRYWLNFFTIAFWHSWCTEAVQRNKLLINYSHISLLIQFMYSWHHYVQWNFEVMYSTRARWMHKKEHPGFRVSSRI